MSSYSRCKKLIEAEESKRHIPTISHYRDNKNPMNTIRKTNTKLKNPTLYKATAGGKKYELAQGWNGRGNIVFILYVNNYRHDFKTIAELKSWLKHATKLTVSQQREIAALLKNDYPRQNPESALMSLLDKIYDAETRLNSAVWIPLLKKDEQALIAKYPKYFTLKDARKSVMLSKQGVSKLGYTQPLGKKNPVSNLTQGQKNYIKFGKIADKLNAYAERLGVDSMFYATHEYRSDNANSSYGVGVWKGNKHIVVTNYNEGKAYIDAHFKSKNPIGVHTPKMSNPNWNLDYSDNESGSKLERKELTTKGYLISLFKATNGNKASYYAQVFDSNGRKIPHNHTNTYSTSALALQEANKLVNAHITSGKRPNPVRQNKEKVTPTEIAQFFNSWKGQNLELFRHQVKAVWGDRFKFTDNDIAIAWKKLNNIKNPVRQNYDETAIFETHIDETLDNHSAMFQGAITGKTVKAVGSDFTNRHTARLGRLALIIVETPNKDVIELKPSGNDAWLSMDIRKNLQLSGKDVRIKANNIAGDEMRLLGKIKQIDYVTQKQHIEKGETVRYFHELGEVTKEYPTLWIDKDGMPVIVGGNYDVWKSGIVN